MNPSGIIFAVALLLCITPAVDAQDVEQAPEIKYVDGHELTVVGKFHEEVSYARLPLRYQTTVRPAVWRLAQHSAGISLRFRTNSRVIKVRWTLTSDNLSMAHMPATGVSGVDLYGYTGREWRYIKTGFPRDTTNEATLVENGDGVAREYLLNLPLYNGVAELEVGVESGASLTAPVQPLLTAKKPVVYYGTSIAQGGCASRPGMAYTNILARRLDRPFVNLGFSGNGTIETSIGEAMGETDAALFVVDCNPNTKPELIYDRTLALVQMLKNRRPGVPVLLVERFVYHDDIFTPADVRETVRQKNNELRRAYDALKENGVRDLHYLPGNGLLGQDHEGTVDGIHPTDVGMARMAEALEPVIRKLL